MSDRSSEPAQARRLGAVELVAAVALVLLTVTQFRTELARVLVIVTAGTLVEHVARRVGKQSDGPPRWRDRTTDLLYVLLQPVLARAGVMAVVLIGATSLAWLPGLLLRPLVTAQPPWLLAVELLALFDLAGYWAHRASHLVPVLWRFHAVHHSPTRLDALAALRVHPFDGVSIGLAAAFLVGAGFDAAGTVGILVAVQTITGAWAHLDVRWRLRPLQRLVLTPVFHHWHHADEPEAHGTNFGQLLPIWDLLFGTYRVPADRYPTRYGIAEPLPMSFWDQLRHPFASIPVAD